jgi:ankyrin repeat protein
MTALHWGASYGNTEHVKMLLKAKASVKLLDVESRFLKEEK